MGTIKIYTIIPVWVKPLEMATKPEWLDETKNRAYKELLDINMNILTKEELVKRELRLGYRSTNKIKMERTKKDFVDKILILIMFY